MEGRERIRKAFKAPWWIRNVNKKHFQDREIDGHWPKVRVPAEPSLILWENLGVGKWSRCMRSSLVWLGAFLIMTISFIAILAAKAGQNEVNEKY